MNDGYVQNIKVFLISIRPKPGFNFYPDPDGEHDTKFLMCGWGNTRNKFRGLNIHSIYIPGTQGTSGRNRGLIRQKKKDVEK